MTAEICPVRIRYGTSAETATQCSKPEHLPADQQHEGPGLPQFPGQRVTWLAGDRREYAGDWPGYCGGDSFAAALGICVLPLNHPGRHAP